jgi:hypothetical protein
LAFELHIKDEDQAYLDGLPLSGRAKAKLEDFIDYAIRKVISGFRNNPENRPNSGKPVFVLQFFIVDAWGDDRWHTIDFTVDDSQAADGKLVVVFVDHADGEWVW